MRQTGSLDLHLWTKRQAVKAGLIRQVITEKCEVWGPWVVSITVKTERPRKRFPKAGEMVRLENRKGLFRVVRADARLGVADVLQRVGKIDVVEQMVPAELIHPVPDGACKAIRAFLRSSLTHKRPGSLAERAVGQSLHDRRATLPVN